MPYKMHSPKHKTHSRQNMKKTKLYMDTVVDIQVVTGKWQSNEEAEVRINRAFEAFRTVEQACSRFSPDSELMKACRWIETSIPASPFLFEPLKFALEMARWTEGVFDPTVGKIMEDHGFNRHYLTGQSIDSPSADSVTYRDIVLNEHDHTLYLRKPLVIDLGAVAKGFAIDLAANELKEFEGFVVNAGGDLFAGGVNERGKPWEIGIQHPDRKGQIIHSIEISDEAVCTSGSYERKSAKMIGMHHLIDPKTEQSPNDWVSCSVIAPFAMMADAFSTASFLLGAESGRVLVEQAGLKGIWITPDLQIVTDGGI
jgi:thiamine biosynthesis lipoprotein